MALKVLSIEVGQATTKVVEMDYKAKNPKIYNVFTVETPSDVVQDGAIVRNEEFIVSIKSEIRRRQIKTSSVVFTVSSGRIANREARIPYCKPKNIMPIIMANASDYFPVDMNQYHLVYSILGTIETKEEVEEGADAKAAKVEKQYRLSLLAVPNDVTTSYIDLAKSLELELKAIDYVGNSVYQAVREKIGDGTSAILKIEEHTTLITIINNGEIVLQRQIAHGLNQAIENLMETDMFQDEELSYAGASRKFLENKIIRPHLNLDAGVSSDDANEEDLMVKVMITENLRYLVGNISRIFEYFTARNEDKPIVSVYLVGLGADYEGLDTLLSNELGYDVKKFTGFDDITIQNVDPNAPVTSKRQMVACIGAATNPLQLLSADLLKGEKEINMFIPFLVMVIGVGAAIAMFVIGSIMLAAEESKTADLEAEVANYSNLQKDIDIHNGTVNTYNTLTGLLKVENYNKNLKGFIEEMESKMPETFEASTFTVTAAGVNVGVRVNSKEEAAKVIEQFRTFKSVNFITSTGFTEILTVETEITKDAEGNDVVTEIPGTEGVVVEFSVSLSYKDYYAEEGNQQ